MHWTAHREGKTCIGAFSRQLQSKVPATWPWFTSVYYVRRVSNGSPIGGVVTKTKNKDKTENAPEDFRTYGYAGIGIFV